MYINATSRRSKSALVFPLSKEMYMFLTPSSELHSVHSELLPPLPKYNENRMKKT